MTWTRRLLVGGAVVAAACMPLSAAQAKNADPHAKATFLGAIDVSGKHATLKVRYNCGSGQALWVSAKQSASGKKDARFSREGSSKLSSAWWQSHRNRFVCNGKPQTATVTIDKVEKGSKGTLKPGVAYVQFCVTKGERTLILSKSGWVKIA